MAVRRRGEGGGGVEVLGYGEFVRLLVPCKLLASLLIWCNGKSQGADGSHVQGEE